MKEFKLPNYKDEKTTLKTIRMKISTLRKLEKLCNDSKLPMNRIINECIEFALNNINTNSSEQQKDLV